LNPKDIGKKYDRIAQWWDEKHRNSVYGVTPVERALKFVPGGRSALDVGCGAGGRIVRTLQSSGFIVTGIDVSEAMVDLAIGNHPDASFYVQDICTWQPDHKYDFIVAWDSIFHLPLDMHRPVLDKLCNMLETSGILIYTFGNAIGEHTDTWQEDEFYYSSIGINGNLAALIDNGLTIMHLELDQFPERHVYVIAQKP
jgi:2-polyprenyl-3-methyl-5-hydroxy-6-metoxy-1,4-benzoquinol methylase